MARKRKKSRKGKQAAKVAFSVGAPIVGLVAAQQLFPTALSSAFNKDLSGALSGVGQAIQSADFGSNALKAGAVLVVGTAILGFVGRKTLLRVGKKRVTV